MTPFHTIGSLYVMLKFDAEDFFWATNVIALCASTFPPSPRKERQRRTDSWPIEQSVMRTELASFIDKGSGRVKMVACVFNTQYHCT